MTCSEIMTRAYRDIFNLDTDEKTARFEGQRYNDIMIEYANMRAAYNGDPDFNIDTDAIRAQTETGCEGVWIAVYRERGRRREYIATVKTLDEGRAAWIAMGALAGELTYAADLAAWNIYRAEAGKHADRE